jgi:hypothetical protein
MNIKSIIGLLAVITVVLVLLFTTSVSQSQPKHYTVKLYSANGVVVGTWDAINWGTVDGQTLTFSVGDRNFPNRVRISGTFSVEEYN